VIDFDLTSYQRDTQTIIGLVEESLEMKAHIAVLEAKLAEMDGLLREARDSVIEDKMSAEAHEMQHSAAELGKLLDRIDARIGEGEG